MKSWNCTETLTGSSKAITEWPQAIWSFAPYCETGNQDRSQSGKVLGYTISILCWSCKAPHFQVTAGRLAEASWRVYPAHHHNIKAELRFPDPAPYAGRQLFLNSEGVIQKWVKQGVADLPSATSEGLEMAFLTKHVLPSTPNPASIFLEPCMAAVQSLAEPFSTCTGHNQQLHQAVKG